ncbi:MAG: energy transducer TonB [Proteobacteria bacterium]|jgi:protein TonB|nr:energy transducer TonB [Pseudomonadota bacterium]
MKFLFKYTEDIDLKWMLILSFLMHFLVFQNLHIDPKPIVKKLDLELIMEIVKPKPKELPPPKPIVKEPPPPPPKPIVKEPPPLPKPVIEQPLPPPLPQAKEPEPIKELPVLPPEDIVPIDMPREETVAPKIDPLQEAKIIEDYGQLLAAHISQFKRYPRIAQRRGWEGELTLEVRLDKHANILNIMILNKSNYDVLDQEAIKMIERSKPLPKPTDLTSETFTVFIPIKFGLQ